MRRFVMILLLITGGAHAAFELQCFHPALIAQGNIFAQHPGGLNPAALTGPGWSGTVIYGRLYNLRDLQVWSGEFVRQWSQKQRTTVDYTSLGNQLYREQTFAIGYGRALSPYLAVGLKILVYDLYIQNFQIAPTLGLAMGTVFRMDTNCTIGFLLGNLNQPRLHNQTYQIPRHFTCGLRWQLHPHLELAGELYKDLDYPLTPRLGCRLKILSFWSLIGGVQFNPDRLSGGTAIRWHDFTITLAVQQHMTLPLSFYWSLCWH